MGKKSITSVENFEDFFNAFNNRDWDAVFEYLSDDCVWNASEQRLQGRESMMEYWNEAHRSIKETLGKPQHVVFGQGRAYLQVPITMEFIGPGTFMGKAHDKGDVIVFWCADAYTFAADGTISECRVYLKFND